MTNPGNRWIWPSRLFLALVLLSSLAVFAQDGRVQARLSANTVAIDESLTLTVVSVGVDGELDLSALEADFDVVGRSSSRQVSYVNGARTATVAWAIELLPKRLGIIDVPPIRVGQLATAPMTLTVTDVATGGNRELFVEAVIDNSKPYVQAQVLLTVRVFQGIRVMESAIDVPAVSGLTVLDLDDERRGRVERDGRVYDVSERRFALAADNSGPIDIGPVTLTAVVAANPSRVQGFFSPTRRLTRRSATLQLDVQARPPNSGTGWWLPAQQLALVDEWTNTENRLQVGEPVTRTIRLRADGVSQTQLPALTPPQLTGAGLYADSPQAVTSVTAQGLRAEQTDSWAIIPQRSGTLEIPALEVPWFDTAAGETRVARLPAKSFVVLPAAAPTAAPDDPRASDSAPLTSATSTATSPDSASSSEAPATGNTAPSATSAANARAQAAAVNRSDPTPEAVRSGSASIWRTAAMAGLMGWLLTALTWLFLYRRQKRDAVNPDTGEPARRNPARRLESLLKARAWTADEVASEVLNWAEARWSEEPPRSLVALARRVKNTQARRLLTELDATLYRPGTADTDWSRLGPELARLLQSEPQHAPTHPTSRLLGGRRSNASRPLSTL